MKLQKIIFSLLLALSLSLTADLSLAGGRGRGFFGSSYWDRMKEWVRENFAAAIIRKDDSAPICGDGRLDRGEECDDGNAVGGDGCGARCLNESVCGNGILERNEECDDGNAVNRDGCNAQCKLDTPPCTRITESATIFNVNSVEDVIDAAPGDGSCATATGTCTLRAAIMESNRLEGDSVIMIPAGTYNLVLSDHESWPISQTRDLDLEDDVVLCGEDARTTIIDAQNRFRVIEIHSGVQARIENLTLTHGWASMTSTDCGGAGLLTAGDNVTILRSIIKENTATSCSSGVGAVQSDLTIIDSTIIGNRSECEHTRYEGRCGGAISIDGANLNMSGSSVVSNSTNFGGAVLIRYNQQIPHSFSITNSTISGNTSLEDQGGAIHVVQSGATWYWDARRERWATPEDWGTSNLTLLNSTVTDNSSGLYGNVFFGASYILDRRERIDLNVRIINSIIGANHVADNPITECAVVASHGTPPSFTVENSLIGPSMCPRYEPLPDDFSDLLLLGELTGSTTPGRAYVPLLEGSPAINAGNPATCTETDQLGRPRVGACDIGAVEFRP